MPANPKLIASEIEALKLPSEGSEARLKKALAKLPKNLRQMLLARMGRGPDGKEIDDYYKRRKIVADANKEVRKMSKADRMKVFKARAPSLVREIANTWDFIAALPYTAYAGKPYRCPASFEQVIDRQWEWSEEFLDHMVNLDTSRFTPAYLAAWAPHIQANSHWGFCEQISPLLACCISRGDKQGREVRDILIASGNREHEIGDMGNHVIRSLLMANDPEGWTWVEKLLLAAQREEGLRYSILRALPVAHPSALRRMFRLIVEHKLARFSAVTLFVNEQFNYRWDSVSVGVVNRALEKASTFLDKPAERTAAWKGDDGESAYLALWAAACEDASNLTKPIQSLLGHTKVEMRYAAACMLSQLSWNPKLTPSFTFAFCDEDVRVPLAALHSRLHNFPPHASTKAAQAAYEALVKLFERMPKKKQKLKPLVWPWAEQEADRLTVGLALVDGIAPLKPTTLIPHVKDLPSDVRSQAVSNILAPKKWTPEVRAVALEQLASASSYISRHVHGRLKKVGTEPGDFPAIEALLTRKTVATREAAIGLILDQKDPEILASVQRLLASAKGPQRLAGLEILRRLSESDKLVTECIEITKAWCAERKKLSKEEGIQSEAILDAGKPKVTLDDGLGFFDPADLTISECPTDPGTELMTPATTNILKALDALVHKHRKEIVIWKSYYNEQEESPLGEARIKNPDWNKPIKKQRKDCPLIDLWEDWYAKRPKDCRDKDGLEIQRAAVLVDKAGEWDWKRLLEQIEESKQRKAFLTATYGKKPPNLKYQSQVDGIITWLAALNPPSKQNKLYRLDWAERACTLVPSSLIKPLATLRDEENPHQYLRWGYQGNDRDIRTTDLFDDWADPSLEVKKLNKAAFKRLWQLVNWIDKPIARAPRNRASSAIIMRAYDEKRCTFADITDHIIGPREGKYGGSFGLLGSFTKRKLHERSAAFLKRHPEVAELVDKIRMRILEIELDRGEQQTAATEAMGSLNSLFGTNNLIRVLTALDGKPFARGRSDSKGQSLTVLIAKTYPGPKDTPASFSKEIRAALKAGLFPEERILQLAFHAPQWVSLIESHLKWNGFSEAIYWFLAHMSYVWGAKEDVLVGTEYDDDKKEDGKKGKDKAIGWDRLILERTALTREERGEGCVDVQWFHKVVTELGGKRFDAMATAARYASTPAAAKRAKYIADVLRGTADRKQLIAKIHDKKLKENVRLLGLLPLPKAASKQAADIRERYEILQGYHKYARGLSSLSKPDALRACEIGLENMARTAGYRDPMRMQWALEAASTKDLAKGFLEVKSGEVVQRMDLDNKGMPVMTVRRGDKALKSVPTKERKLPAFVELRERAAMIKKQASRSRNSLQEAMCRCEFIEAKELVQLAKHALLWPMISNLVLAVVGKEKTCLGYPEKKGKSLRGYNGKSKAIPAGSKLRIAHAHDLLQTKKWHLWQRECLAAERVQPFKQVFRELYVPTGQEKKSKGRSQRFAGQQVNPRQAKALWAARGWQTEEDIWKTFPDLGMSVDVDLEFTWGTAAEVEGWTLDTIQFRKRDSYKPVALDKVPPVLFSETMRDCDLVVSVAHRGQVDPEASASTVEMRTTLVKETCQLLGLKNVELKKSHALIDGEHNTYSVHLGSGQVHLMPGGHLWLVPVHAQHRGRIFLPFADDDPKTAEVLSKVLLLARDTEIKDPEILKQLRRAAK